jgi:ComF family protein
MARSAGLYEGILRSLVHQFKYDGSRRLARLLAGVARAAAPSLLAGVTAVVPVPLHPLRRLRRGFNQCEDLAHELGPPVWRVLRRVRHGPMQTRLPSLGRQQNASGAFACRWRWSLSSRRHRLRGQVIVLLDDVMTTGATADECSRVLVEAGASEVRVLTIARAATRRP